MVAIRPGHPPVRRTHSSVVIESHRMDMRLLEHHAARAREQLAGKRFLKNAADLVCVRFQLFAVFLHPIPCVRRVCADRVGVRTRRTPRAVDNKSENNEPLLAAVSLHAEHDYRYTGCMHAARKTVRCIARTIRDVKKPNCGISRQTGLWHNMLIIAAVTRCNQRDATTCIDCDVDSEAKFSTSRVHLPTLIVSARS